MSPTMSGSQRNLLSFSDGTWLQRGLFGAVVARDEPATPEDLAELGYVLPDEIDRLRAVEKAARVLILTSRCLKRPKFKYERDPGDCGGCTHCLLRAALNG